MKTDYLLVACLCFLLGPIFGQKMQPYGFVENKGQVLTQDGSPSSALFLYNAQRGLKVQIHAEGFSYDAYQSNGDTTFIDQRIKEKRSVPKSYDFHRVDVNFLGANPNAQIEALDCADDYLMYYPDPHSDGLKVWHYQKITCRNLYPNIDLEWVARPGTAKPVEYNFILHPGARLADIRMEYRGANATTFSPAKIDLHLKMGTLSESIPASYWEKTETAVEVQYQLIEQNNGRLVIGLKGPSTVLEEKLIVDPTPTLLWATYFGDTGDEYAEGMLDDGKGHLLIYGSTGSSLNLATTGVHQSTAGGKTDGLIAVFNKQGQRIWAGFYGGSEFDDFTDMAIDFEGNLVFCGYTYSSNGIASAGAFGTSALAGESDGILVKLRPDGTRIWARYYGTPEWDVFYTLAITPDPYNNICVGGGYQNVLDPLLQGYNGRSLLLSFTDAGEFRSEQRFSGTVWFSKILADDRGFLYMVGPSEGGLNVRNALQSQYKGDGDIFVIKTDPSFNVLWATYFGGSAYEGSGVLVLDAQKNLYLTGHTYSPDFPTTANAANKSRKGTQDAFLAKFNTNGQLLLSTYVGGFGEEHGATLALDPRGTGHVYICGGTNENLGLTSTDSWQESYGGSFSDGFLSKLDANGQMIWSTYFGGESWDSFRDMVVDSQYIYCLGASRSQSGIATENAFQPYLSSLRNEMILAKFKDCFSPLAPKSITPAHYLRLCSDQRTTLKASGVGYLSWYSAAKGGRLLGRGDSLFTEPLTQTTTFYVQDSLCERPSARTAITVQVTPRPNVFVGPAQVRACVGEPITLQASGAIFHTWDGDAVNGRPFVPAQSRTYRVIATGLLGCRDTGYVEVILRPRPQVSGGPDQLVCGDQNVVLKGSGANTYTWDRGVVDGQAFKTTVGGIYKVIGTDQTGCKDTAQVILTIRPKIEITVGPNRDICKGDTLSLKASGAATYDWDQGIKNGEVFQPDQSRTYTVIGTDANQCKDTAQVQVQVNERPQVVAGADQRVCLGDSIQLKGSGASTYQWSDGVKDGVFFAPQSSQTYTLIGSNGGTCLDTAQVKITVLPRPQVVASPNLSICAREKITLTGSGAKDLSWDRGVVNGRPFQPSESAVFTLTGVDENQCKDTAQVRVTVRPRPDLNVAFYEEICEGQSLTLSGQGASKYTWDQGVQNGVPFKPRQSSTYLLIGENDVACKDTLNVKVTVKPRPRLSTGPDRSICAGDSLSLRGSGAPNLIWDQGVKDGQAFRPQNTATYTLIGLNEQNCADTIKVLVEVNPLPFVRLPGTVAACAGNSLALNAEFGTGTPPYRLSWSNGASGPSISFRPENSGAIAVTITDAKQCQASTQSIIQVNPKPRASITAPRRVCEADSLSLQASATQGRAPYLFSWNNENNGTRLTIASAQAQKYSLYTSDASGCRDTLLYELKVEPKPKIQVQPSQDIRLCEGLPLLIQASGGSDYTWTNPRNVKTQGAQLSQSTPLGGIYQLSVGNTQGCTAKTEVKVDILPRPVANIEGPGQVCAGEKATLKASGGSIYRWSNGSSSNELKVNPVRNSVYELEVKDQNACADTTTFALQVQALPVLALPAKIDLKLGKTIELKVGQDAERYQWSPAEGLSCTDCPNPVFKAQKGGQYCVAAFLNGCQKDTCTTITVSGDCPVYVPNAFSPNADGQNDTFCAYSPCLSQVELSIYDRWGNLLYRGDCWDGRSRGQELVIGTYFYRLSGMDVLGARVTQAGEFWLGR